jgi:ferric-dicitrate binding protein FerR (iron transport regulator)
VDVDTNGSDEVAELIRRAGRRPALPADEIARIRSATHAAWSAKVGSGAPRRQRWAIAAAAAAAIGGGGLGLWVGRQVGPGAAGTALGRFQTVVGVAWMRTAPGDGPARVASGASATTGSEVSTSNDGRLALLLPSGHSVRMDSGSSIRLISASSLELQDGAVYVDSGASRVQRPLVVRTRLGVIRDVGTQFEVRLAGDTLRIRVREGAVRLVGSEGRFEVTAGRELSVAEGGSITRRDAPGHGPAWDWVAQVTPMFDVEGRPLGEFLAWIVRERGWTLSFAHPDAADHASAIRMNGAIDTLTLDEALDAVMATCNLTYRVEHGVLTIE